MKKTPYQQEHEDISAIIAEAKVRKGWGDKDIGRILGVTACTVSKKRTGKVLPEIPFCKVAILADAAGYDIRFVKRERYT